MRLSARYWYGMILLLLLVTWLGARKLNADGIWFDEWWSLYVSGADVFNLPRSPGDIWTRITTDDIRQGVLYPLLLAGWGSVVGWTEYATRALSLFAGLIALAAVFRLGRALSRQPLVGLGGAVVLGTSAWFIFFLHEMRVYMLLVMFMALLLLIYQRLMDWRREPGLADYVALALVTGLLLNTHYFAGIAVGVVGLWHLSRLVTARPTRRWWRVMVAWLVAGLMLVPWLVNLPRAAEIARNEPRVQPDVALLLEMTRDTFSTFSNTGLALLALLLVFSLLARPSRRLWLLTLILLPLNLAAYYAFSLNELRYNMALLPLLALIVGFGVNELAKRRVPPLLILGIWVAGALALDGDFQMERTIQRWPGQPIREMATVLEARVAPEDVIVNLLGNENRPTLALHPLDYYMRDFGARIEVVENSTRPGTQAFAARLREAVVDANRIWLLYDPRWASAEWALFEYVLNEQNLYHCGTLADTDTMLIQGFGRMMPDEPGLRFGEDVAVSVIDAPVVRDGHLQVWLAWGVGVGVPPGLYSLALHLLDSDTQLQAQFDSGLPATGASCRYVEIPVDDLSPGTYQLHMTVYNWQTGERLMSNAADGLSSDYPLLDSVTVTQPE